MKQFKLNNLEKLISSIFILTLFLVIINFDRVYGNTYSAKILSGNQKMITNVFSTQELDQEDPNFLYDMFSSIDDFVSLPEGGTPWQVFGDTGMDEYTFEDSDGFEWTGVRPEFTDKIKKLANKQILVQGFMFPLDQNEKQKTFLLIPFPVHCPYYPHASSNLIIEVHANKPIVYSYDPVNISGKLELVPKDDLYNIFFRLRNANLVTN